MATVVGLLSDEEKVYKNEQRARMAKYVVGGVDVNGNSISKIYSRGDEFVVYEISGVDESESFKVFIDTEIESDPKCLIAKYEAIKEELADFRSILHKGVRDKSIKHRAAHAVSTALRRDAEAAKAIFSKIKKQVEDEYRSVLLGRLIYLSGAVAVVLVLTIGALTFYLLRDISAFKKIITMVHLLYGATFAALGGLLSISINLTSMTFERELNKVTYFMYGCQRITFSALAGIFAFMAIQGGLIFGLVQKSSYPIFAILAICIISGFSETLIPNALKNIESKNK